MSFAFCYMICLQTRLSALLWRRKTKSQTCLHPLNRLRLHFIKMIRELWLLWQYLLYAICPPTALDGYHSGPTSPCTSLPFAMVWVMKQSYSQVDHGCSSSLHPKVMTQPRAHWPVRLVLQLAVTSHLFSSHCCPSPHDAFNTPAFRPLTPPPPRPASHLGSSLLLVYPFSTRSWSKTEHSMFFVEILHFFDKCCI